MRIFQNIINAKRARRDPDALRVFPVSTNIHRFVQTLDDFLTLTNTILFHPHARRHSQETRLKMASAMVAARPPPPDMDIDLDDDANAMDALMAQVDEKR